MTMPRSHLNQQGFTLLEVLLAVSITALIGIGASQLLSSIANTSSTTNERASQLRTIQRMDLWVRRDLWQLAGRDVLDDFGTPKPALTNDSDFLVEFTHSGLSNAPFSKIKRSNLQRVAYAVRGHDSEYCKDAYKDPSTEDGQCFVRLFWSVLDLATDSPEPIVQVLLDNINEAAIFFRGQTIDPVNPENTIRSDDWQDAWPSPYRSPGMIPDLVQIKLVYSVDKLGEIERLYEVPRFAFVN